MYTENSRVYYELTTACNLRCAHCFNNGNLYDEKFLSIDTIFSFHEIVKDSFGKGAVLTGGEPLLHPEFNTICNYFNDNGCFVVTTNATLFNDQYYLDLLNSNNNMFLQISVDAFTEQSFEAMRGKHVYDLVMKRLKTLSKCGFGGRVGISTTITKFNIKEVNDLINFARELKLHSIHFPTLIHEGGCKSQREIIPDVNELNQIENEILKQIINLGELNISSNTLNQLAYWQKDKVRNNCMDNPTLKVTCEAELMPCPVICDKKYTLGNVSDIKNKDDIIKKLNQVKCNDFLPNQCITCEVQNLCKKQMCENCCIRGITNSESFLYRCQNIKYHLNNIKKELE